MSYKKYWTNSTNQESYEPYPEWDIGFNELFGHCFNPERNKQWYLIAYHNLSNYHIKLKQKTTVKIHLLQGVMETLINCMVNRKNTSFKYRESEFDQIKSQITLGSEFQKESKLEDDKILHMKVILNDLFKEDNSHKYERNYTNNTDNSHKYEKKYTNNTDNSHKYERNYTNNTEDSEILSHCEQIIKSQQWYKDGYNLIVRFYKKIQKNLLPKKTAYAAIGTLLNCLINNTNVDPVLNKSNLFFINNYLENKNSSFYTKSKLDIKYIELNYIYKEWYFAYGFKGDPSGICKPRDNNYNHNHQYNYSSGAHPPPPPPRGEQHYNYRSPPPRGSAGGGHWYNRGSDKHSHYKGLVHSRCDTANRDHKWYKDAFDLIIQVKDFAQGTRSKDDYGIVGLLLNCIVNNKNTIIDRETNGSEWRKIGLIFHPDRIERPQAKEFIYKTGYTKEQMFMLYQIQSEL